MQDNKSFLDNFVKIIKEPPYHIFAYVGAVFVIETLITRWHFEQAWIFFLYSVIGTMWRYAQRDFKRITENNVDYKKYNVRVYVIYHSVNIMMFLLLVVFLVFTYQK